MLSKKNLASSLANGKRKRDVEDGNLERTAGSSEVTKKKNKQRVLMLSSRGVTHRMRHLMNDLEVLLPHIKKGKTTLLQAHLKQRPHAYRSRLQTRLQKPP